MNDSSEIVTLTAIVTGRVQGVGYRQFVWHYATHLGLAGWARNRPDGSVEVVARGPRAAIDAFRARLRQGPPHARVEDVSEIFGDRSDLPEGQFQIRS